VVFTAARASLDVLEFRPPVITPCRKEKSESLVVMTDAHEQTLAAWSRLSLHIFCHLEVQENGELCRTLRRSLCTCREGLRLK